MSPWLLDVSGVRPVDVTGSLMRQEPGSDLFLTQRGGHLSRSGRPESRLRIAQRWVQCYHAGGMAGQRAAAR